VRDRFRTIILIAPPHRIGTLRVTLAAAAGYGWYQSKRDVGVVSMQDALANVTGSPTGPNVGLHGRATYDISFTNFYLRPQ
jgi:Autotransporter beta-domain